MENFTPTLLPPPTVISSRLLCSALTANLALPSQHKLQHTEEYWQVYDA